MKALSIVKPNGTRIAQGEKTLEIRRWHPDMSPLASEAQILGLAAN